MFICVFLGRCLSNTSICEEFTLHYTISSLSENCINSQNKKMALVAKLDVHW